MFPNQVAYYIRQLYFHNVTALNSITGGKLSPQNTFCFTLTEDESGEVSNEIASAVYDCFKQKKDLTGVNKPRLFSYGCGSQNRNLTVMVMIVK